MAVKTFPALKAAIASRINDNGTRDISEEDVRETFNDVVDSLWNRPRHYINSDVLITNRTNTPTQAETSGSDTIVAGSTIERLAGPIRQTWRVDSDNAPTLHREEFPDDQSPLESVPNPLTGWNDAEGFTVVVNNPYKLTRYTIVGGIAVEVSHGHN